MVFLWMILHSKRNWASHFFSLCSAGTLFLYTKGRKRDGHWVFVQPLRVFYPEECEVGIVSYAIVDGLCLRILAGLFTEYCWASSTYLALCWALGKGEGSSLSFKELPIVGGDQRENRLPLSCIRVIRGSLPLLVLRMCILPTTSITGATSRMQSWESNVLLRPSGL